MTSPRLWTVNGLFAKLRNVNNPGGFRTHDLRIKRTLPRSDSSYSQSTTQSRADKIVARNAPEEQPYPVTGPSLESPPDLYADPGMKWAVAGRWFV